MYGLKYNREKYVYYSRNDKCFITKISKTVTKPANIKKLRNYDLKFGWLSYIIAHTIGVMLYVAVYGYLRFKSKND